MFHETKVGNLITNPDRRQHWVNFVRALHEASQVGGPLENWVFHGTDAHAGERICREGLQRSHAIAQSADGAWVETQGVHFGSAQIAAFYAEDRIESTEDPDIDLLIFAAPLDQILTCGDLVVDGQTLDCPIDSRLGATPSDLFAQWERSPQDANSCWSIYGTLLLIGDVPSTMLTSFRSEEDVHLFCRSNFPSRKVFKP